jgi:hypothetical protein
MQLSEPTLSTYEYNGYSSNIIFCKLPMCHSSIQPTNQPTWQRPRRSPSCSPTRSTCRPTRPGGPSLTRRWRTSSGASPGAFPKVTSRPPSPPSPRSPRSPRSHRSARGRPSDQHSSSVTAIKRSSSLLTSVLVKYSWYISMNFFKGIMTSVILQSYSCLLTNTTYC